MPASKNVAAVCGTALNQRHIQVIKRFADRITLVLDGDEAGQRRTNEVLEHFVRADVDLRIMTLPDGTDPCDFVQQFGANEFRSRINAARDALDHKIEIETAGVDLIRDTHRANRALDNILQNHRRCTDHAGRFVGKPSANPPGPDSLVPAIPTGTGCPAAADCRTEKNVIGVAIDNLTRVKNKEAATVKLSTLVPWEKELIQIVLRNPELVDRAIENIAPGRFVEGPCLSIYENNLRVLSQW